MVGVPRIQQILEREAAEVHGLREEVHEGCPGCLAASIKGYLGKGGKRQFHDILVCIVRQKVREGRRAAAQCHGTVAGAGSAALLGGTMHYVALATDYDGTIAHNGEVDEPTLAALERLRGASRRLVLVTGRELDDLIRCMPRLDLFDIVVAENGALLYWPATKQERALAAPPPPEFAQRLREADVSPLSVGRVIVASWEPNEGKVLATIRDMGLELQIIFNKGAVMVLPAGINKESGLRAALRGAGHLAPQRGRGGGCRERLRLLGPCGMPVAVANALPRLKDAAALVTEGERGAGVAELVDLWLSTDLAGVDATNPRQHVPLAAALDGEGGPDGEGGLNWCRCGRACC